MIPNSTPAARKQTHVLAPLTRPSGPKFHRRNPRKIGQIPGKSYRVPTPATTLLVPHTLHSLHQYNPCRGSSIGRACGSYNSKEINLKVVGSSPTFGYSYITSFNTKQLFFCTFWTTWGLPLLSERTWVVLWEVQMRFGSIDNLLRRSSSGFVDLGRCACCSLLRSSHGPVE